jgi:protocatechuate 3,4-dioxygenase beta subunit
MRTPVLRDKSTPKPRAKTTPLPPNSKSTKSASPTTGQIRAEAALGGVRVTVVDGKTGKAVPGATVLLKGKPGAKTDDSGRFQLGDLKPGTYSISVRKTGFENGSESFTVKAGGITSLRIRLVPASAAKPTAIRKS